MSYVYVYTEFKNSDVLHTRIELSAPQEGVEQFNKGKGTKDEPYIKYPTICEEIMVGVRFETIREETY